MIIEKANVVLGDNHKATLIKEKEIEYLSVDKFNTPEKIVQVLNDIFMIHKLAEEYVYLICLTNVCEPICVFEVSHGSYKYSYANGREIMIRALLCGAASIVIVHNHPSGDCKPSKEDTLITEIIQKVCKIVGMDFTDHIIIGEKGYYSFMEHEKELYIPTRQSTLHGVLVHGFRSCSALFPVC